MVREEGQGATEEGDVSSSELHSPVSLILHNLHPPMHCFALHSLLTLKPHLLNNAAAHCPLCLVTRLHCRKQSDNAWLDVPDKTTLSTKVCLLPTQCSNKDFVRNDNTNLDYLE